MNIKILGSGCPNCRLLEENTRKALKDLNIDAEIEKITDYEKIAEFGIMSTPALVVDGEIKIYGMVPTVTNIKKMLEQ